MNEQVKHPCFELRQEMKMSSMNQKELSLRTGVTEKHISSVLNGTRDISVAFARKLGYVFEKDATHWIELQARYNCFQMQLREENEISQEEINILKTIQNITDYFIERGHLHNHCGVATMVMRLRSLLGVCNLTTIPAITYNAAYRAQISKNVKVNPYVLFAWQRLCEKETESIIPTANLDLEKLKDSIDEIKQQMHGSLNDGIDSLRDIFKSCGIAFQVVKNFRGAPVQGFIKRSERQGVILCLTFRGGRADVFWFTLFHEIGHILHGDTSERFVDFDSVSGKIEDNANIFASNTLIKPDRYKQFLHNNATITWEDIKLFAEHENVIPSIILGRLQKDGILEWTDFADKIVKYKWAEA